MPVIIALELYLSAIVIGFLPILVQFNQSENDVKEI